MTERQTPERPEAGLQRMLKIAVTAMGLLIVIGLGAVVFRLARLASEPGSGAIASAQTLTLPSGAAVRSLSLSGQRLAVHYSSPGGEGIALLDVATGRVLSRIRVAPGSGAE